MFCKAKHIQGRIQGGVGNASPHQLFSATFLMNTIFFIISTFFDDNSPCASSRHKSKMRELKASYLGRVMESELGAKS